MNSPNIDPAFRKVFFSEHPAVQELLKEIRFRDVRGVVIALFAPVLVFGSIDVVVVLSLGAGAEVILKTLFPLTFLLVGASSLALNLWVLRPWMNVYSDLELLIQAETEWNECARILTEVKPEELRSLGADAVAFQTEFTKLTSQLISVALCKWPADVARLNISRELADLKAIKYRDWAKSLRGRLREIEKQMDVETMDRVATAHRVERVRGSIARFADKIRDKY